jgi:hypothetical protein
MSELFSGSYYENTMGDTIGNLPSSFSASSDSEQLLGSVNAFNRLISSLTWGWVVQLAVPFGYYTDTSVAAFVDLILLTLRLISAGLIGAAAIEFIRNMVNVT